MKYVTTIDEREYVVEIVDESHVIVDGKSYEIDFESICDQPVYSLLKAGKSHEAYVYPVDGAWQVLLFGRLYAACVEDEREKRLRASSGGGVSERAEFHLKSPMPGMVVAVKVADGQAVQKGDVLIILESMKMQNELKSPRAGVISRLRVQAGDRVEQQQTMLSVV